MKEQLRGSFENPAIPDEKVPLPKYNLKKKDLKVIDETEEKKQEIAPLVKKK